MSRLALSIQGWIVVNGVNFGDKNWGSSLKFALKFAREFYRFSTVGWLRTTALDRRYSAMQVLIRTVCWFSCETFQIFCKNLFIHASDCSAMWVIERE